MTSCRCLWSSPQCPKINLSTHHPTYLFQTFSSSLAVIIGSSIPREVAQPSISDSSDTLLILLPWRMKTYGNHCYLNCQLQCLSLNPFVEVYSCATDKINKDKKLFYDSLYVWCVVDLLCDIGRGKTISTVQRDDEMQDPTEIASILFNQLQGLFQQSERFTSHYLSCYNWISYWISKMQQTIKSLQYFYAVNVTYCKGRKQNPWYILLFRHFPFQEEDFDMI